MSSIEELKYKNYQKCRSDVEIPQQRGEMISKLIVFKHSSIVWKCKTKIWHLKTLSLMVSYFLGMLDVELYLIIAFNPKSFHMFPKRKVAAIWSTLEFDLKLNVMFVTSRFSHCAHDIDHQSCLYVPIQKWKDAKLGSLLIWSLW